MHVIICNFEKKIFSFQNDFVTEIRTTTLFWWLATVPKVAKTTGLSKIHGANILAKTDFSKSNVELVIADSAGNSTVFQPAKDSNLNVIQSNKCVGF